MELRFVPWENTFAYFDAVERYLLKHGRRVAFYSDKHTVFRNPRPSKYMTGMTQFGRALAELSIEILCANSSQAKGRVERANRTLQDRLVKELRLARISSIDEDNRYLEGFVERYNAKFAMAPTRPDNLHRPLNLETDRLSEIFCLRDKRYVSKDLTIKYASKRLKLDINDVSRGLVGTYVDTYELPDGRVQVRAQGRALPYTVLNPDRRVTHAAITENKRLSAVLSYIKAEQYKAQPHLEVKPSSASTGYKKTGRRSPGRPSKLDQYYERKRAGENA